ncbi:TetR/AcrR family transcriptional regulator [Mycolicibacterium sp. XJ1904]
MGSAVSRDGYFGVGIEILSDLGYGGLKLAEVCQRLGVTTGSFYHYFPNWPAYTRELLAHWTQERTVQVIEAVRAEPNPRRRIDALFESAFDVPHSAESAIRVWSALDPHVHEVQVAVDQQRFDILYESAFEILQHKRQAQLFAECAVYVFVGYEQTTLPRDTEGLRWISWQLREALDDGRFATVPDGD